MTAVPPRPAAPDATAGDGLREAIADDTVADTVLALADDFLAKYGDGGVDPDDVYDWLIRQAAEIRGTA